MLDGDSRRRVARRTRAHRQARRAHGRARRRPGQGPAACGARHGREPVGLRRADGAAAVSLAPQVDAQGLPHRAAMADVRRDAEPDAGAGRDPRPAAVSDRLVEGPRRARRVPRRRPGRRRLRRERARQRPRARDVERRCDLAARHAAREDGRVAGGLARRARRARHGRSRLGPAPLRRSPALALRHGLARRVARRSWSTASMSSAPGTGRSPRSTCGRTACAGAAHDGCKITSSAALAGSTIYIGDYCGRLLALRAKTGRSCGLGASTGGSTARPQSQRGRVFVPSSTGGSLTAFSTRGRYLWRRSTGSYVYSSPAVANGRVFFGSYNGVFYGAARVQRRDVVVAFDRRPHLGCGDGRRRRGVRGVLRASHPRRRRVERPRRAQLPARPVRARLGRGQAAVAARLLARVRRRREMTAAPVRARAPSRAQPVVILLASRCAQRLPHRAVRRRGERPPRSRGAT